jgi:small-conductance mechanosensitive channel
MVYLNTINSKLAETPHLGTIILTIALFVIYFFSSKIIKQRILKNQYLDDTDKVLSAKKVNQIGRLLLIAGIVLIWFSTIHNVLISVIAFAAAIVLALKEVIMCFTGGLLVRVNKYFKLGDRIEIDGNRGFVIAKTLSVTRILEIGPEKNSQQTTGRIISIPNSLMLNKPLTNESFFQGYSIKTFIFSPLNDDDVAASEKLLLDLGSKLCAPYLDQAQESICEFCRIEGIAIPSVEPRVKYLLSDSNKVRLVLKIPIDNKHISDLEQQLIRQYIAAKPSKGQETNIS